MSLTETKAGAITNILLLHQINITAQRINLKEFIDTCHKNNIAVILDVVYNQCADKAPQAQLYWDAAKQSSRSQQPMAQLKRHRIHIQCV